MWALAMEILGDGPAVPYETCVNARLPASPPSRPIRPSKREHVAELLSHAGFPSHNRDELLAAVDAWRKAQAVPMASIRILGAAVIGHFEMLSAKNVAPYLPVELHLLCPAPIFNSCPSATTPGFPAP